MKRYIEMRTDIGREWTKGNRYEIEGERDGAWFVRNNYGECIPVRKTAEGKSYAIVTDELTDEEVHVKYGAQADLVLRASLIDRALKDKNEDLFESLTTNGWNDRMYSKGEDDYVRQ